MKRLIVFLCVVLFYLAIPTSVFAQCDFPPVPLEPPPEWLTRPDYRASFAIESGQPYLAGAGAPGGAFTWATIPYTVVSAYPGTVASGMPKLFMAQIPEPAVVAGSSVGKVGSEGAEDNWVISGITAKVAVCSQNNSTGSTLELNPCGDPVSNTRLIAAGGGDIISNMSIKILYSSGGANDWGTGPGAAWQAFHMTDPSPFLAWPVWGEMDELHPYGGILNRDILEVLEEGGDFEEGRVPADTSKTPTVSDPLVSDMSAAMAHFSFAAMPSPDIKLEPYIKVGWDLYVGVYVDSVRFRYLCKEEVTCDDEGGGPADPGIICLLGLCPEPEEPEDECDPQPPEYRYEDSNLWGMRPWQSAAKAFNYDGKVLWGGAMEPSLPLMGNSSAAFRPVSVRPVLVE